jgi:hypothetical protein
MDTEKKKSGLEVAHEWFQNKFFENIYVTNASDIEIEEVTSISMNKSDGVSKLSIKTASHEYVYESGSDGVYVCFEKDAKTPNDSKVLIISSPSSDVAFSSDIEQIRDFFVEEEEEKNEMTQNQIQPQCVTDFVEGKKNLMLVMGYYDNPSKVTNLFSDKLFIPNDAKVRIDTIPWSNNRDEVCYIVTDAWKGVIYSANFYSQDLMERLVDLDNTEKALFGNNKISYVEDSSETTEEGLEIAKKIADVCKTKSNHDYNESHGNVVINKMKDEKRKREEAKKNEPCEDVVIVKDSNNYPCYKYTENFLMPIVHVNGSKAVEDYFATMREKGKTLNMVYFNPSYRITDVASGCTEIEKNCLGVRCERFEIVDDATVCPTMHIEDATISEFVPKWNVPIEHKSGRTIFEIFAEEGLKAQNVDVEEEMPSVLHFDCGDGEKGYIFPTDDYDLGVFADILEKNMDISSGHIIKAEPFEPSKNKDGNVEYYGGNEKVGDESLKTLISNFIDTDGKDKYGNTKFKIKKTPKTYEHENDKIPSKKEYEENHEKDKVASSVTALLDEGESKSETSTSVNQSETSVSDVVGKIVDKVLTEENDCEPEEVLKLMAEKMQKEGIDKVFFWTELDGSVTCECTLRYSYPKM